MMFIENALKEERAWLQAMGSDNHIFPFLRKINLLESIRSFVVDWWRFYSAYLE